MVFSIRILLFGKIDLPTPISHPPSRGTHPLTAWCTHHQKYICELIKMDVCKYKKTFDLPDINLKLLIENLT